MAVKSTWAWVPCNDRSISGQQVRQLASCGNSHFDASAGSAYTVNLGALAALTNVLLAEVQNIKGFGDAQIFLPVSVSITPLCVRKNRALIALPPAGESAG
jgi:hypothetical protein